MSNFSVGDRVICVREFAPGFNGREGIVTHVRQSYFDNRIRMIHVSFDGDVREWRADRFVSVDPTTATLSPVYRKIRQMEKRWANFQQRKAV